MNADSLGFNMSMLLGAVSHAIVYSHCCLQPNLYNNNKYAELVWLYIGYWNINYYYYYYYCCYYYTSSLCIACCMHSVLNKMPVLLHIIYLHILIVNYILAL